MILWQHNTLYFIIYIDKLFLYTWYFARHACQVCAVQIWYKLSYNYCHKFTFHLFAPQKKLTIMNFYIKRLICQWDKINTSTRTQNSNNNNNRLIKIFTMSNFVNYLKKGLKYKTHKTLIYAWPLTWVIYSECTESNVVYFFSSAKIFGKAARGASEKT